MILFPNCKINLGLHIISKRADGYHNIETVFSPVPLKDCLEILPSDTFSFHSYGIHVPGNPDENLCVKAFDLLNSDFGLPPVQIHLLKNIPTGAGLGGGSSDAAFTLRALNEMFVLDLNNSQLTGYAARLGSDCPFFIGNVPCAATGRGEVIQNVDVDLSSYKLLLVKPMQGVSTREAFAGSKPMDGRPSPAEILQLPVNDWKKYLVNDFEASVFELVPEIRKIKDKMYASGAIYASMSGSGSAVFGLFRNEVPGNELFENCFYRVF